MRIVSLPARGRLDNPYFELFSASLERCGAEIMDIKSKMALIYRFDIIHVHFPEHYVTEQNLIGAIKWSSAYAIFFAVAKLMHKKVVRSVHDIEPLKKRHAWLLRPFMNLVRALTDGYVFLTDSTRQEFFKTYPDAQSLPHILVEHGPYEVTQVRQSEISALRADILDSRKDAFVIGFLGNIKTYKGIEELENIPRTLLNGRPIHILIAGRPDSESSDIAQNVVARLGTSRATWINKRITDELLDRLIRMVDCVFLPYKVGWNSGLAMLILCNRGRLVGSRLPVFGEVAKRYGAPYAYQYREASELAGIFSEIATSRPTAEDENILLEKLSEVSFDVGAEKLMAFYKDLFE